MIDSTQLHTELEIRDLLHWKLQVRYLQVRYRKFSQCSICFKKRTLFSKTFKISSFGANLVLQLKVLFTLHFLNPFTFCYIYRLLISAYCLKEGLNCIVLVIEWSCRNIYSIICYYLHLKTVWINWDAMKGTIISTLFKLLALAFFNCCISVSFEYGIIIVIYHY